MTEKLPVLTRALWRASLVDEATLREWLVNVGQRDAGRRMAHIFCELYVRMDLIGQVEDNGFHMPLTQQQLPDILGLSMVHVNRMLQSLRDSGLITFEARRLEVRDFARLQRFALFDPTYLHADRGSAQIAR